MGDGEKVPQAHEQLHLFFLISFTILKSKILNLLNGKSTEKSNYNTFPKLSFVSKFR